MCLCDCGRPCPEAMKSHAETNYTCMEMSQKAESHAGRYPKIPIFFDPSPAILGGPCRSEMHQLHVFPSRHHELTVTIYGWMTGGLLMKRKPLSTSLKHESQLCYPRSIQKRIHMLCRCESQCYCFNLMFFLFKYFKSPCLKLKSPCFPGEMPMCPDLGNVPGAIPLLAWEKRRQFGELGPLARWPVKGDLPPQNRGPVRKP